VTRRQRHLVLFARPARLGAVKTRLAAAIGPGEAWRFHRRTMDALVLRLARDPRWRTWLALSGGSATTVRSVPPLPILDQGKGDLGRRMAQVFAQLPPGPAILVGVDIPTMMPGHIAAAFRALGSAEAVFGPAQDGGYWLVGFRRSGRPLDPFVGVRWSTAHALADTLAHLPKEARVATVATLEDVDEGRAYARWRARR